MFYYDWVADVEDAHDFYDEDELFDLCYKGAEKEILRQYNEDEIKGHNYEDRVNEEASNIIGLYFIKIDGILCNLIELWYKKNNKDMMKEIRSAFIYDDKIFFVTGYGYDILSSDLLGGTADGEAKRQFNEFVKNKMKKIEE